MQFNLVGVGTEAGGLDDAMSRLWLGELAQALVESGEQVDWWYAVGDCSSFADPASNVDRVQEAEAPASSAVVHRHLGTSNFAARLVQLQLLPQLSGHGEAAVVGHGFEVASLMIALDLRLRAAGVREQAVLVWLAPQSFSGAEESRYRVDWERLKRACSIVAPNANVRQELTALRVGSFVIDLGADGARRFVKDHIRRSGVATRTAGAGSRERVSGWA